MKNYPDFYSRNIIPASDPLGMAPTPTEKVFEISFIAVEGPLDPL